VWAIGFALAAVLLASALPAPASPDELRDQLRAHLSKPQFSSGQWGVHIVSLDTGRVLFSHNAERLFTPASVTKLFTAALALDSLGPEYRIRTSLYTTGAVDRAGTLRGSLVFYGRGDPVLAALTNGISPATSIEPLVNALKRAGIKRLQGDLVADESFFRGPPLGAGWDWDDLAYYYAPEVSALSINNNAIEALVTPAPQAGLAASIILQPATSMVSVSNLVRTGPSGVKQDIRFHRLPGRNALVASGVIAMDDPGAVQPIAVPQPSVWAAQLLKDVARRRGILIGSRVKRMGWIERDVAPLDLHEYREIGAVESPPLRDLLMRMLKSSHNLTAQSLLLQVGANCSGSIGVTTEEVALAALRRFLERVGIKPGEVSLVEGTGLARQNLTSPMATVGLLDHMARHQYSAAFRAALPVAGVDGTLKDRMKDTPAAGNARAKTGTLGGVSALAGYVTTAAGEPLAFALFVNNCRPALPARPLSDELDQVVAALATLDCHSRNWTDQPRIDANRRE
jgi:D-alanyl-D-alanine carboxypeptidase/D-alanyl-D-alanine-endopeptidase (penicillin-binding protein 4)